MLIKLPTMLRAGEGSGGGSGSGGDDSKGGGSSSGQGGASTGITQEELKQAIEKARLEERTKLNQKIQEAEKTATDAQAQITELQSQIDSLKGTLATLEKVKTAKDGEVNIKALVKELTENIAKQYQTQVTQEREKLGSKVNELTQSLSKFKLEKLRDQLVTEAGGAANLVMALVKGESEDELRASIETAKTAYEEIKAQLQPDGGKSGDDDDEDDKSKASRGSQGSPNLNSGASNRNSGAGRGSEGTLLTKVRSMNSKEFAQNRDKVMADLRKRFG